MLYIFKGFKGVNVFKEECVYCFYDYSPFKTAQHKTVLQKSLLFDVWTNTSQTRISCLIFARRIGKSHKGLYCVLWREKPLVWVLHWFGIWIKVSECVCINKVFCVFLNVSCRDYSELSRQSRSWLQVCGEHSSRKTCECVQAVSRSLLPEAMLWPVISDLLFWMCFNQYQYLKFTPATIHYTLCDKNIYVQIKYMAHECLATADGTRAALFTDCNRLLLIARKSQELTAQYAFKSLLPYFDATWSQTSPSIALFKGTHYNTTNAVNHLALVPT